MRQFCEARRPLPALAMVSAVVLGGLVATPAHAQPPDGSAVFERACAMCHVNPAADSRAAPLETLRQLAPEAILNTLSTGNMFRQGSELTTDEKRAVAGFVAGRPVGTAPPVANVGRCPSTPRALSAADLQVGWNGWGATTANTRFQSAERGGLTAPMVPRLTLKWAFGLPGVTSAKAQPSVVGGRVFVASEAGDLFSLDAETGCTYWTFHAQAGVRSAVSVGPYGGSGYAVYLSDVSATAYAVDAATGRELWRRQVDDHPFAGSTGSPTVHDGRVYVVTSGVGEEGQGGRPGYPCCSFRGSVTALEANTGQVVWKSYSIVEEPRRRGTSSEGLPLWGPAGGGIWGAPTIDPLRSALYVTTGNNYAPPAQPTTDAVLAFRLSDGELLWVRQPTANDVWAGGCGRGSNPNCPEALGPDHDFSMSPVLTKMVDGRDILIVHQKSGMVYGLDPDNDGTVLWEYRASPGSGMGGQWGATIDGRRVYVGVRGRGAPGGMRAIDIDTGLEAWSREAEPLLCGDARGCAGDQGGAVTAIPGAVFSASMDGGLRAYAAENGNVIWQFDTNREFETVNGVPANGGAMDGPGPIVANGMVFVNSGYVSLIGRPGNVLLAFGPEQ